jgi:cation:H+ antiporter
LAALPESAVTFVAVVFGETAEQREIGVGAALGGPLVLATIAYAVAGLTLILCRAQLPETEAVRRDFRNLSRDQGWFLAIFVVKIALGLVVFAFKPWLGVFFLVAYAAYFWKEMRQEPVDDEGGLEPLKLVPRRATPPTASLTARGGCPPRTILTMRSRPNGVRRAFLWMSIRLSHGQVEVSTTSASSVRAGWTTY